MDVFDLRERVVGEYERYTRSFLNISDPWIHDYVHSQLERGTLWPDALVQLSPGYEPAESVADLAHSGVLHQQSAAIFQAARDGDPGKPIRLYRHQREAIDLAAQHKHFVVTTGTGSGKSLAYLVPIVDHVIRNRPEDGRVRAIIVYPMNALINSQEKALNRFVANIAGTVPSITFARYTGQESESRKREIQQDPPHILLTNYVMLELMLTRPDEFRFVDASSAALQFVVLDELHTYRGRQGADVALLLRRLRDRCGNPDLVYIGTSATMASGGDQDTRRAAVASVASRMFGVDLPPQQVVEETLVRSVSSFNRPSPDQLAAAVAAPLPAGLDWSTFKDHPLAAWIESKFSLDESQGRAARALPRTLLDGARDLADSTGVDEQLCADRLRSFFQLGSAVRDPSGKPGFAWKLHQFISQGSAVYATLDSREQRRLTLEGQRFIDDNGTTKQLYPLAFCRECGQHYYLCAYDEHERRIEPRVPLSRGEDVPEPARAGYLLAGDELWSEEHEQNLPDGWFTETKRSGRKIKSDFRPFVPRRLHVQPSGEVGAGDDATIAWFLPMPFLTCLRCGVVYTRRERDDFGKLARLSSEGRSTSTTLLSLAAIDAMRHSTLPYKAQKLLSFTDNRQDASLQAGHVNDFVGVARLRAAIYRALNGGTEPLDYRSIGRRVFEALDLPQEQYAKTPALTPGARRRNEDALTRLIEYRVYEDLRRSWRVTQPNLEQCGLLRLDYLDLAECCAIEELWNGHPMLAATEPTQRERTIRALLEHMRRELAIDAPPLEERQQDNLRRTVNAHLNDLWSLQDSEILRSATWFVRPGDDVSENGRSLTLRTGVGRFLRAPRSWDGASAPLDDEQYAALVDALLAALVGANLLVELGSGKCYQIRHDALLWTVGDGATVPVDVIRQRRMAGVEPIRPPVNRFFRKFYSGRSVGLRNVEAAEHTGQIAAAEREKREERFRAGELPILCCSPTMELGIDIADLNMVHMRNVPPTPANYAQRSGRAGRSGQPAFVATYCSTGSGHDQYFFRRPLDMVSGVVAPPQIELANEDLLRAHVHAVWLGFVEMPLGRSMLELIDASSDGLPLHPTVKASLDLAADRVEVCFDAAKRVLADCIDDLSATSWYSDTWLHDVIAGAAEDFDDACDRWRELYTAADDQLRGARHRIDLSHQRKTAPDERRDAERLEMEARRQKELLGNQGAGQGEADFYPYRYFASEGFLPGYNFPRLPVSALLRTGFEEIQFVQRPRFLAVTEFAPQNVIYHNGRKYRVTRTQFRAGDPQRFFVRAKLCKLCGYFHEGEDAKSDVCQNCETTLGTSNGELLPDLLEMTTQGTQQVERITSEEEERMRQGYRTSTHYRFASDSHRQRRLDAVAGGESVPQLSFTYGPQATVLRINHGWRRTDQPGFTLNLANGVWQRRPDETPEAEAEGGTAIKHGVRIFVQDTRNVLLAELGPDLAHNQPLVLSLQYALLAGIREHFQLEDDELNAELLGNGPPYRMLIWEATEGGAGVLRRLVEEPDALARVAAEALRICHVNPASGEDRADDAGECTRACYRCLLSYSNQPHHGQLDRQLIRDVLRGLSRAVVHILQPAMPPDVPVPDGLPPLVRRVLDTLTASGRRLPDATMRQVAGQTVHLFYGPRTAVLCLENDDRRDAAWVLEDAGYRVITLRAEDDLESQLARHTFWNS